MKNIKPFGPSIGITKISNKFFDKLNKEFDKKSKSKKIDYSSKLASQIKNELKISILRRSSCFCDSSMETRLLSLDMAFLRGKKYGDFSSSRKPLLLARLADTFEKGR